MEVWFPTHGAGAYYPGLLAPLLGGLAGEVSHGCGSKPMGFDFGVGAPPILGAFFLVVGLAKWSQFVGVAQQGALSEPFFGWEDSPIDYRKKVGTLILTSRMWRT